jgi:hypothetical protein
VRSVGRLAGLLAGAALGLVLLSGASAEPIVAAGGTWSKAVEIPGRIARNLPSATHDGELTPGDADASARGRYQVR